MKKDPTPPDKLTTLIAKCIQGDDAAKAEFYVQYSTLVRNAARWALNKSPMTEHASLDAEDITQEVFVRLFSDNCRALGRLRNPHSINAWLITLVLNHVRTIQRKHTVRMNAVLNAVREQEEPYIAAQVTDIAEKEKYAILHERLESLPAQDRLVIELYFIQGLKYSEIASLLRLNVNTVSARLRRAKAKLRGLIEGDLE